MTGVEGAFDLSIYHMHHILLCSGPCHQYVSDTTPNEKFSSQLSLWFHSD